MSELIERVDAMRAAINELGYAATKAGKAVDAFVKAWQEAEQTGLEAELEGLTGPAQPRIGDRGKKYKEGY